MKKTLSSIIALLLCLMFAGCSTQKNSTTPTPSANVKVTVSTTPMPTASGKLDYQVYKTNTDYIVVIVTNTTGITLGEVQAAVTYYKGDQMLDTDAEAYYKVAAGKKLAFCLDKPEDENYKAVDYDKAEVTINTDEDTDLFVDRTASIKIESNKGSKNVLVKSTNIGTDDISYQKFQVVYYKGTEVVGCEMAITSDKVKAGNSMTLEASFPHDMKYKTVSFDSYEVLPIEIFLD